MRAPGELGCGGNGACMQPSMAFGCATSAVSAILLGFCSTYTSACLVRFLAGLLNGTLAVTKSVLSELCDG